MLLMATESPDYEFILVDAGVDRPTLDFLLQQLRHDSRTADLPVGVLASPELLDRARHAVRNDARAEVFLRSHDDESIRWMVDRLVGLSDRDRCSFAERQTQAVRAIELLTELCDRPGGKGIYDLSGVDKVGLSAIAIRSLSAKAVGLLGDLGTPEGQSALVELASRSVEPLETRKAAVAALLEATRRHGILLTTKQIRQQYDRYNQNAKQDAATQEILGRILDILEAPSQAEKQGKPKR